MGNFFCILIGCSGGQGAGYVRLPSQPPGPASSSHGATDAEAAADEPTVEGPWYQLTRHLLRVAFRRRLWSALGDHLKEIRRRGRPWYQLTRNLLRARHLLRERLASTEALPHTS